jgi:hypothetical protein
MGDVLNGYCAIRLRRVLSANVTGRQGKAHQRCQQNALWSFSGVWHSNGRVLNIQRERWYGIIIDPDLNISDSLKSSLAHRHRHNSKYDN